MKSSTIIVTHEKKFGHDDNDDVILQAEKLGVSSRNPDDLKKNLIKKSQTMKENKKFGEKREEKGKKEKGGGVKESEGDYTKWIILAGIVVAAGFIFTKKN